MLRRLSIACCLALILTGCDQNLSTTIYVRDINDLLASDEAKELPLDIQIEILEVGIDRQCSKPEGAQLVEAISAVFAKATLVGCEKISGSMKDRMVIKATTTLARDLSGDTEPSPYLVSFIIYSGDRPNFAAVFVQFDAEKYEALNREISRINPMASIKVENVRVVVKINNDERSPVILQPDMGTFADSAPIDVRWETTLEPRQEVTLRAGDVKMASLARTGLTVIAFVRTEIPPH